MATQYKGYAGKVLDVNLTDGTIGEYPLTDADREKFLGGRFLSTKILWDQLSPGIDPLSPDNLLVVMTSPMTGTGAPSSSRYDISAKSPQTGAIGHSNSGGHFGMHLKRAGWDGIVVRGRAETPVYIDINEDEVQLKSAGHLWGKNTEETQEQLGKGGKMVIGPAGENLIKYAVVVSQERVHGRTGMGAVMGAKNLKAIVAAGQKKIELAEPEKFRAGVKKWVKMLQKHPATGDLSPKYGTAQFVNLLSAKNALPTRNFSRGSFDGAYNISGEKLASDYLTKNYGCPSCPIRCGRRVELDGKDIKGPEYETLCLMGSNLEIDDMPAIIRWNYEMDLLGIDTMTTGNTIGFATELNEKGFWQNGIEFGKKENISEIIQKIAYRQDIGDDLAEGVRFLSQKYGGEEFAAHVKGLEIAGYSPRAAMGHALGYATSNRGACHLDGGYMAYFEVNGPMTLDPHHYRSKPSWTILDQNLLAAISAGGNCLFTAWTFVPAFAFKLPGHKIAAWIVSKVLTYTWFLISMLLMVPPAVMKINLPVLPHSKFIRLATGMKMDFGRFLKAGARGYNLERLFNIREGIAGSQDTLPQRFTDEPLIKGKPKTKVPLSKMLPPYYKLRGWDANGIPTAKTLKKLNLEFVDRNRLKA
ncbi:MAG TPA: aldehyde ferredoxin oxidoreductase family protein [Desulfosalsimonadaceae bacterium]|nr:aldehyde ferredoxin oxidoreductase family protein [Desulfosalsimonadaceae bacterium]